MKVISTYIYHFYTPSFCCNWGNHLFVCFYLPGAATAAAPAEAAGVWGIGGGLSHPVTRLEGTGSCFLVDLDLSLTHLHPLCAHGLPGEGEETRVRARLGRGSLTPSWNITANITRSEKSHEIKDLTAGVLSREVPTQEKQHRQSKRSMHKSVFTGRF